MKSIKLCSALLLLLAVTVGCEKESIESPEMQLTEKQEPKSLYDFVNSGVNIESHLNKVQRIEAELTNTNKSQTGSSSLNRGETFFDSFCDNLPTEGFELGRMEPTNAGIFTGPLDHIANVGKFKSGEILEGISVTTKSDVTTDKPILGLYGQEVRDSYSKVIYAQIAGHDLVIDFTGGVQSVSLDILSFPYAMEEESTGTESTPIPIPDPSQKVTVKIIYTSGLPHIEEEVDALVEGVFWGTTGTKTISQIVLSSTNDDAWVGVDNIAFGLCEDNDADGCVDAPGDEGPGDDHLNSNLETTVKIGTCDSGVKNKMTAACGVSMSDSMDILETEKYRNKGSWQSAVAALADQWIAAELITLAQKDALMACASSFNYLPL